MKYLNLRQALVLSRAAKGHSRDEAAAALQVEPNTMRRWESGENQPQVAHMLPICEYCEITLRQLYGLLKEPIPQATDIITEGTET